VNASSLSAVQPDDLDLVWTYTTTTRAQAQQERLVKDQPEFQVRINKRPSNFEQEEYSEWEEDPQQNKWQMGEVQPQEPEEMEHWERVSNGPDMERTIRRSPSPPENEWTPILNGTLRIRRNDPRKCTDKVPKHLKTHKPPPPPPSPMIGSSTQHWNAIDFCWNCRPQGHTMSQCRQPPLEVPKVSHKIPFQKQSISQNPQNTKAARKCSNCHQEGHNRTKCPLLQKDNITKCTYCKGHHSIHRCNKRENNQQKVKRTIPEVEYIRNKENLGQELEIWPDLEVARWMVDKKLKEEYNRYMEMDRNWQELWKDTKEGNPATETKEKEGFFYTYRRTRGQANGGWRLIIPRNLNLRGMLAIESLIQEAHDQTGHGGLRKTYSHLQDKYSWINQYQDTKEYVASCNTYQLSKGTT